MLFINLLLNGRRHQNDLRSPCHPHSDRVLRTPCLHLHGWPGHALVLRRRYLGGAVHPTPARAEWKWLMQRAVRFSTHLTAAFYSSGPRTPTVTCAAAFTLFKATCRTRPTAHVGTCTLGHTNQTGSQSAMKTPRSSLGHKQGNAQLPGPRFLKCDVLHLLCRCDFKRVWSTVMTHTNAFLHRLLVTGRRGGGGGTRSDERFSPQLISWNYTSNAVAVRAPL